VDKIIGVKELIETLAEEYDHSKGVIDTGSVVGVSI